MRVVSLPASRGSQKWLQVAVNEKRNVIDAAIFRRLTKAQEESITWISPLTSDEFAEYRDDDFLERLNVELAARPLLSFWPRRGPQWDGLGKTKRGSVFLVEAKSHLAEIQSPASQAGSVSKKLIEKSFKEVKSFLGVESEVDWSGLYYQYANRIAHLYLLRELNKIPAYLVFLCFLNDKEMNGPTKESEWLLAVHALESHLGIPTRHRLSDFVLHVFVDVNLLG